MLAGGHFVHMPLQLAPDWSLPCLQEDAPGSPVMSFNRPGWKFHLLCIQSGWHSSERRPLPELRVEMCFNGTVLCSFAIDAASAATGDAAMHYGKRVAV